MKRVLTLFVAIVFAPNIATAAIIFESGTLGPTGIPWSDLTSQVVPGTNIKDSVFIGVRFELSQPVLTSQIGGHFAAPSSGTFFGAIVELDDENDFPDSVDLTSPDVLGTTLLTFPEPSAEVFGDLVLTLDPGWYALVFGSGLFGATTNGGAVRNGTDIGDPTYISALTAGTGWSDITSIFPNHRFVVSGQIVPEGSSIVFAAIGAGIVLFRQRFRRG